ncbi:MAG: hypothetical protein AM326_05175 [Candidatus Thorarchaeota archaeon SMTZ-45]|nr:MAG: hypothetical protein AM325_13365 [Candidatus Thorarchaeota archaeon SMTZ1-45]KXH77329.1 MAG: hypothetical protein AM326_05175 [Candidatus Thorarchaeota archaeon SMTZ-45]
MFRNLTDNIPKNIGLYSVGVMLLFLFRITIDLLQTLLGLLAFLISYSSIYVLNDLFDVDDDKKDNRKAHRKPLANDVVKEEDAIRIFASFLLLGLVLSVILNLLFFCVVCSLVFTNIIYSLPMSHIRKRSFEEGSPRSLKHTILSLPLVLLMQLLKIFLPWTLSTEVMQFPVLFAIGFSLLYVIIFKGYKEYRTIGESVKQTPFFLGFAIIVFVISMSMYPEPLVQASIVLYILLGIWFFRNSRLTDRKVLLLSPVYILLGIVVLFFLISNI